MVKAVKVDKEKYTNYHENGTITIILLIIDEDAIPDGF